MSGLLLVDAHAHLHDKVPMEAFLAAARDNFRQAAGVPIPPGELRAVLCLADFPGAEGFSRLQKTAEVGGLEGWRVTATGETASLCCAAPDGDRVWLVAGRKVVSGEGLELLALGIISRPAGGQGLFETVRQVIDLGALPVLPWGVGKWWGRRGRMVRRAMVRYGRTLPLGDIGGRPWCWRPLLLEKAKRLGVPIFPGSDPLRVPADRLRSGAFGTILSGPLAEDRPFAWLRERLAQMAPDAPTFGNPLPVWPFLQHQIALRRGE